MLARAEAASTIFGHSRSSQGSPQSVMVGNLRNVDEDLAKRVAAGLGIPLPPKAKAAKEPVDMPPSDALSIHKNMKDTLEGRAVGILIADGTDAGVLDTVVNAVTKAKGKAVLVAPRVGGAKLSDGSLRKADGQLAGTPSQIFDAVAIILSDQGCAALMKEGAAVEFAMNAFAHLKAIGPSETASPLLGKVGFEPDGKVKGPDGAYLKAAGWRFYNREPGVRSLMIRPTGPSQSARRPSSWKRARWNERRAS